MKTTVKKTTTVSPPSSFKAKLSDFTTELASFKEKCREQLALRIEKRNQIAKSLADLDSEIATINQMIDPAAFAAKSAESSDPRRIYFRRNVGDAYLKVLPTNPDPGMTVEQLVSAVKSLSGDDQHTYNERTLSQGIFQCVGYKGVDGYYICRRRDTVDLRRFIYYKSTVMLPS